MVLMVLGVALVEANVVALDVLENVIPVDASRSPKIVLAVPNNEPANPVKLRFNTLPLRDRVYVPPVKLKLIAFASVGVPGSTVTEEAVLFVTVTFDVPVTVRLVAVDVSNTVPVAVTLSDPLPKAIVRIFALLLSNAGQVKENETRFKVPRVNVNVLFDIVNAAANRNVPPNVSIVIGNGIVFPAEFIDWIPLPENVCVRVPDTVTPEPSM